MTTHSETLASATCNASLAKCHRTVAEFRTWVAQPSRKRPARASLYAGGGCGAGGTGLERKEMQVTGLLEFDVAGLSGGEIRAVLLGAVAVGLLYCFLGYRLFKVVLGLTGFLMAGVVAGAIAGWLTEGKLIWMAVAGVGGGFAGAVAMLALYKVGVFCLGLIAGALIAHNFLGGHTADWAASAAFAAAVFGGLIALVFERTIMTMATAAIGAWIAVQSAALLLLGPMGPLGETVALDEQTLRLMLMASWCVLGTAGAAVQLASYKPKPQQKAA